MKIDKNLIGGSTNMLILTLLSEEDSYGYQLIRELEERSDHTFQFKEGTLYPILHKLENSGYVVSYKQTTPQGKSRKYYQITKKGLKQLEAEKAQWNVFSASVNKVIGGGVYGMA